MAGVLFKSNLLFIVLTLFLCTKLERVTCAGDWTEIANNELGFTSALTQPPRFRLPTTLAPTNYQLKLLVVLDPLEGFTRFTASGEVFINISCIEPTSDIFLHAVNLTISHESVRVVTSNESDLAVRSLTYELENDFLIISLGSALQSGEAYGIHMKFVAPIPDYRLNGMYQDFYEDPDSSETRYLATTLFAPYHARRLFPCFDEPSFRAEYDIEITHHRKYHAMSNEEIISSYPVEGIPDYVTDVFRRTPSISAYITAMIVSDFTYEEAPPNNFVNRTVRIYATPRLISLGAGEYAANVTDGVMGFFENRFRIPYPLDKLYSIALPNFFFSAMENIGMITYKEPVLLYLKNETTEEERYTINYVMSHELAHQWFGNIVACKWWAYVWLKEGFATFYSHYGMNHTNPELNPWEMFVPKIQNIAMEFDASNETHPLENFPPTSASVADIYTRIPYQKGASILRMTSTFLTESVFEEAIKTYVDRFQYQSAEQTDVFDALQEELDKSPLISAFIPASLRDIMNSWCQQSKFPIIYAARDGNDDSQIILTQEEVSDEEGNVGPTTWWVPINVQPRTRPDLPGTVADAWIPQNVSSIRVAVTSGEPVIVNPEGIGYYRVQYDESLRQGILELLESNHTKIPSGGRSRIMDDYFQLALSGHTSIEIAMEFTKFIHKDMSIGVWVTFKELMDKLLKLLNSSEGDDAVEMLKVYLSSKVSLALEKLESDGDSTFVGSTSMLYDMLIRWSCDLGSCRVFTDNAFENLKAAGIPKEKQFASYCSAVSRDKGDSVFALLLAEYRNSRTLFGRKQRLLKALTCTNDSGTLKWLIDQVFENGNDENFKPQDKLEVLKSLANKAETAAEVLMKIDSTVDDFYERCQRFGESAEQIIANIAINTAPEETTNTKIKNVMKRLKDLDATKGARIEGRLNTLRKRQARMKNSHKNLSKWLYDNM